MHADTITLDTVDSTMREAERLAAAGRTGPLVICARAQTGGTGRHGRQWASPPGNLYWTMLLDGEADRPRDAGLAFAAGLAVIDALEAAAVPAGRLALKWPNDVLLDGRKVAGVLVQVTTGGNVDGDGRGSRAHTIVGIGVNLRLAPPGTNFPATALEAASLPVPPVEILRDALTKAMLARRAALHRHGLPGVLDAVSRRLHGRGASTQVALDRDRTRTLSGINEGLGTDGALRLRLPDGELHEIVAGDIVA